MSPRERSSSSATGKARGIGTRALRILGALLLFQTAALALSGLEGGRQAYLKLGPGQASAQSPTAATDFSLIHRLIAGGVTPQVFSTPPMVQKLHELNTRRLRLVGVDHALVGVTADGGLELKWPPFLENGLKLCKDNGWTPRVTIGHMLQPPLAIVGPGGRKYGPSSWPTYEKYIRAFLDHVTQDWGFKQTEWEVGNENDFTFVDWVSQVQPPNYGSEQGFRSYMEIYRHISKVFAAYRTTHPDLKMRLGGPTCTSWSFSGRPRTINWLHSFIEIVAQEHLVCDFVSFHYYADDPFLSGAQFVKVLEDTKAQIAFRNLSVPISVSEWGLSWHWNMDVTERPVAGAYAFEFSRQMEGAGVDDAIFLDLSEGAPGGKAAHLASLFTMRGFETHAFKAMRLLAQINGRRLPCSPHEPGTGCVAAKTGDNEIECLLWRFDWSGQKNSWRDASESAPVNPMTVDIAAIAKGNARYNVTDFEINSAARPEMAQRITTSKYSLAGVTVGGLPVPGNSYAKLILKRTPSD